jgi:hypothetical protein
VRVKARIPKKDRLNGIAAWGGGGMTRCASSLIISVRITVAPCPRDQQLWQLVYECDELLRPSRARTCQPMRRDQQSAVFWLWYAEFLARRQPERQDDFRRALNRCEALNLPSGVPQTAIDQLRAKLRDSAGPTAPKDH